MNAVVPENEETIPVISNVFCTLRFHPFLTLRAEDGSKPTGEQYALKERLDKECREEKAKKQQNDMMKSMGNNPPAGGDSNDDKMEAIWS